MDEVSVHLGSGVDMISHPGHWVLLEAMIIIRWAMDLAVGLGRLGPDVIPPSPRVLPQELLRGLRLVSASPMVR